MSYDGPFDSTVVKGRLQSKQKWTIDLKNKKWLPLMRVGICIQHQWSL